MKTTNANTSGFIRYSETTIALLTSQAQSAMEDAISMFDSAHKRRRDKKKRDAYGAYQAQTASYDSIVDALMTELEKKQRALSALDLLGAVATVIVTNVRSQESKNATSSKTFTDQVSLRRYIAMCQNNETVQTIEVTVAVPARRKLMPAFGIASAVAYA